MKIIVRERKKSSLEISREDNSQQRVWSKGLTAKIGFKCKVVTDCEHRELTLYIY